MITDYISRRLVEKKSYSLYGENAPYMAEAFDLRSLIYKKTKRIVLLGDAGYGKSTELRSLTGNLINEKNLDFIPIYIELNTYTEQDLKDYVRMKLGNDSREILDFPNKETLLFLFDEFDQVLDKVKATRNIKNFIEEYSESNFVISCRTNFYSDQFGNDSTAVVLPPLTVTEIEEYCNVKLGPESNNFIGQVKNKLLFEYIANPFFLNHLIDIYAVDGKIPANKDSVFARIISLSLEKDQKKLSEKYDLATYPIKKIEEDLSFLALVMETLQRNYITNTELFEIFSNEQHIQILTEGLSLIRKNVAQQGDVFQFQHNNFQEFLAAERIAKLDFRTILSFILALSEIKRFWVVKLKTIFRYTDFNLSGIKIGEILKTLFGFYERRQLNKINPSWRNTVAFLCSLRRQNDLLQYLMKYEAEMTLKFEKNRLDYNLREKIFKNIFSKYTHRKIWLDRDRVDYDELAGFVDSEKIYGYLIDYAYSQAHSIYRYNAIQILGRMKGLSSEHKNELSKILTKYASDENENADVRHISLYALSWLGFYTPNVIDKLVPLKDCKEDMVVSGLLYLIQSSDYVEQYTDIILATTIERKRSDLMDLSINLRKCIEKINSVDGVKKIIVHFTHNARDYELFGEKNLFTKIIDRAILVYDKDHSIYDDVKTLMKEFDNEHLIAPMFQLRVFLEKTNTIQRFFDESYSEGKDGQYQYSLLAISSNEQTVGFLIKENLEDKFSDQNMQIFINYLYSRISTEAEKYIKIINEKTGKFIPNSLDDYEKFKENELKKRIQVIFRREEFLLEVERIFTVRNIVEISYSSSEEMLKGSYLDEGKYSIFVLRSTMNILKTEPDTKFNLSQLREKINQLDYEYFTASNIYELFNGNREKEIVLSEEQKGRIGEICLRNLSSVDFRVALVPNGQGASTSRMAILLWYFCRKYNLEYPENVLLDMFSFDWIDGQGFVGIDYLEAILPHQKVEKRIISNIDKGINVEQVLRNHISFCKKHKIKEMASRLYAIASNVGIGEEPRLMAIETIASFQDNDNLLENLLEINDNLRLFKKTSEILLLKGNKQCKKKLHELMKSSSKPDFSLESAKTLVEYQNLDAIRFYAKHIMKTKQFEESFCDKSPIQKINNRRALPILFKLLIFSYEFKDRIKQDRFARLDAAVIGALKNIAMQNLQNYTLVMNALRKFIGKFNSKFEEVNFLNIICDDIELAFFINFSKGLNIKQAREKVKILLN